MLKRSFWLIWVALWCLIGCDHSLSECNSEPENALGFRLVNLEPARIFGFSLHLQFWIKDPESVFPEQEDFVCHGFFALYRL